MGGDFKFYCLQLQKGKWRWFSSKVLLFLSEARTKVVSFSDGDEISEHFLIDDDFSRVF